MKTTKAEMYRDHFKDQGIISLVSTDGALLLKLTRNHIVKINESRLREAGVEIWMSRKGIFECLKGSDMLQEVMDLFSRVVDNPELEMSAGEIETIKKDIARGIADDRLSHYVRQGLTKKNPTGEIVLKNSRLFGYRSKKDICTQKDLRNLGITPEMTTNEMLEHVAGLLNSKLRNSTQHGIAEDIMSFLKRPTRYLQIALGAEALGAMKLGNIK